MGKVLYFPLNFTKHTSGSQHWEHTERRLSPSPFVFCEIYEYCMTFEETVSPDKRLSLSPFVFCEIYEYCMTFEETVSPCFFRDYPPNSRMLVV